jgi:hypothetical protein
LIFNYFRNSQKIFFGKSNPRFSLFFHKVFFQFFQFRQ